jgi:nicotinamidase-related amidase
MLKARPSEVFVDVCTQRDYLSPEGARPVANLAALRRNLRQLMALARWAKIPTISCVETHHSSDVANRCSADCICGTRGHRKPNFTLLPGHAVIESDNCPCIGLDVLEQHQQIILAKTHRDPFTNPKFDRLLTELAAHRFVLFGVSLEETIRLLTLGLLLRHRKAVVVYDACGYWDVDEAQMTLRQLQAKSCELVTTHQFVQLQLSRRMKGRVRLRSSRFVA